MGGGGVVIFNPKIYVIHLCLAAASAVPPEWSIIALVIQIPAVTAMGGGQRSFGTFLKIHPFW